MASFELDFKSGGSSSYWSSYNNPAVTSLVQQAQAEFDPTKRAALYARIQALVAQDAPFVPLDYPPVHLRDVDEAQRLRRQPGRRLPARERLASLTACCGYTARRLAAAVCRRARRHRGDVPAAARRAGRPGAGDPRRARDARRRSTRCAISGGSTRSLGSQFVALRRRPRHAATSARSFVDQALGRLADRRRGSARPRRSSPSRRCSRS